MKKLIYFLPLLAVVLACTPKVKPVVQTTPAPIVNPLMSFKDSVSYVLGSSSARRLKEALPKDGSMLNEKIYKMAVIDGFDGKSKFTEEEENVLLNKLQTQMQAAHEAEAEKTAAANKAAGKTFLAENAKKEGFVTTASGLQYKVLTEGTGAIPTKADKVEVHYEGRLIDGTVFDSSIQRGKPAQFGVTQVISGWTEALQLMKEGSKYQLVIPSELAYGNRATGKIKAGDTLIFDVELIKIIK